MNQSRESEIGSSFMIVHLDDLLVVLIDLDHGGRTVTNDAYNVTKRLDQSIPGGLKKRRIFYQDSSGRFDEITHHNGIFVRFAPCTDAQQRFLAGLNPVQDGC